MKHQVSGAYGIVIAVESGPDQRFCINHAEAVPVRKPVARGIILPAVVKDDFLLVGIVISLQGS